MSPLVLGLDATRWTAVVVVVLTVVVVAESVLGHYRSGFPLRAQYVPALVGGALVASGVAVALAPHAAWAVTSLRAVGWLAVAAGMVGVGYHHRYGIAAKAGGYRWLAHYLLYGAPQLAPLALSAAGALAVLVSHGLAAEGLRAWGGRNAVLAVAAVALGGAVLQTGVLHYRGAYNTRLMYAPLVVPPLGAAAAGWVALDPDPAGAAVLVARISLWATFLLGFVGLGMHLRGIDRQMGGLRVLLFNLVQGPPPLAPASFAAFAAAALVALELA